MKLENTDENSDELPRKPGEVSFEERLKSAVFNTLFAFDPSLTKKMTSVRSLAIGRTFHTLQLLSLFYLESPILESSSYITGFFRILSYLRLDYLMIKVGLFTWLFYFIFALYVFSVSLLAFSLYKAFYQKYPLATDWQLRAFKWIFPALSETFQIPVTCVAILSLKYSYEVYSTEYGEHLSLSPSLFKPLGTLICMMHFAVLAFYETSQHEIRHYALKEDADAKSSVLPRLFMHASTYAFCVLHFMFDTNSSIIVCLLIFLVYIPPCVKHFFALSNYNSQVNQFQVMNFLYIMLCAISHVLAVWLEDPNVVTVMIFILSPFLFILLTHVYAYIQKHYNTPDSLSEVERILRPYFLNFESSATIEAVLENNKTTMVNIWKAYHCLGKERSPKRARMSLKRNIEDSTWFKEYQLFRCKQIIEDLSTEDSFKFLKLWGKTMCAIQEDIEITERTFCVWKELLSKSPAEKVIRRLIEENTPQVHFQSEKYKALVKLNPYNIDLLMIYGSFLLDVCGEEVEGEIIMSRASGYAKSISRNNNMSPFSSGNAIIIASSDLKIIHTNYQARTILNYEVNALETMRLDDLYPSISVCQITLDFPDTKYIPLYFLKTSNGNIEFVSINYFKDYCDLKEYTLIVFKENNEVLDAACLLDSDGFILGTTSEFKRRTYKRDLEGANFIEVFKGSEAVLYDHYRVLTIKKNFEVFCVYSLINNQGYIIVSIVSNEVERGTVAKMSTHLSEYSKFDINDIFGIMPEEMAAEDEELSEEEEKIDPYMYYEEEIQKSSLLISPRADQNARSESVLSVKQNFIRENSIMVDATFRRMCVSIAAMTFINLFLNTIMITFYTLNVDHISSSLSYNAEISYNALLVAEASSLARLIDLKTRGYDLEKEEDEFSEGIMEFFNLLERSDSSIVSALEDAEDQEFEDFYYSGTVPLWYLEEGEVLNRNKNLAQFADELRRNLLSVYENPQKTLDSSPLYYIYKNGHSEALVYCQRLVEVYNTEIWYFENYYNQSKIAHLAIFIVYLAIGGIWLAYILMNVQLIFNSLWRSIIGLHENQMKHKYSMIMDRLRNLATCDDKKAYLLQKHVKFLKPHKVWVGVLIAIIVYVTIYAPLIFVTQNFLFDIYPGVTRKTDKITGLLFTQSVNALLGWESLLEYNLLNTEFSIYTVLPEHNPIANVEQDLEKYSEQSSYFIKHVTNLMTSKDFSQFADVQASYLGEAQRHNDFYRLMYNSIGFRGDLRELRTANKNQLRNLYDKYRKNRLGQTSMMFELVRLTQDEVSRQKLLSIATISMIVLFTVLYFFYVIIPTINRSKMKVKTVMKFMELNNIRNIK